jgi:plasmid stabilization system protein ParE
MAPKIHLGLDAKMASRKGGPCLGAPPDHEMKNKQATAYSHRSWFVIHSSIPYRRVDIIPLWQFCGLRPIDHLPPRPHRGAPGSRGSSTSSTGGMAEHRRPIIWSPEARADLSEIWKYTQVAPAGGPNRPSNRGRIAADRRSPLCRACSRCRAHYVISYRMRDDVAEIVRISHGRRDLDDLRTGDPTDNGLGHKLNASLRAH